MTMHEHESDMGQPAAEWPMDELDLRGRAEKLVSQLAELYNENTLLRERVRRLEEMRGAEAG